MLREYDVVHVYNLEFGVDYQAILVSLHDDGTALVRSEITGNECSVEISDLYEIGEAQPSVQATNATEPLCDIARECNFGQGGKCLRGGVCA